MEQFADLCELFALGIGMASLVSCPLFLLSLVVLDCNDSLVGIGENAIGSAMAACRLDGGFDERDVRLADFGKKRDVVEIARSRRQNSSRENGLQFFGKNRFER